MPDRPGLSLLIQREFQASQDGQVDAQVIRAQPILRTVNKYGKVSRSFIRLYLRTDLSPKGDGGAWTDVRCFKAAGGMVEHHLISEPRFVDPGAKRRGRRDAQPPVETPIDRGDIDEIGKAYIIGYANVNWFIQYF